MLKKTAKSDRLILVIYYTLTNINEVFPMIIILMKIRISIEIVVKRNLIYLDQMEINFNYFDDQRTICKIKCRWKSEIFD